MQKEVLKKLEYDLFVVVISAILMAVMYFLIKPSITGYVVFQPTLNPDSNINISNNEYKLNSYTTTAYIINELYTEAKVTKATYDGKDELDKLNATDSQNINVDKDKIFDVKFNKVLNNNDKIYFKTKASDSSTVYLCDASTSCSSPGYGSVSYDGQEDWYSITLSNLPSSKDSFNIDPTKVKFDFINATKNETTITTNTSTFYFKSGIVQTQDIQPSDLSKWDMFSSSYVSNSQNIIFEYSTDSAQTWNTIPQNNNLSQVNSPKIKLRANLTSNGIQTPTLYNIYLNYSAICNENWTCTSWNACFLGSQTRTCTDDNACGTTTNKPAESQSCICNENWTCTDWGSCNEGSQSRVCTDSNSCNTNTSKPDESQTCFHAKDFYLLNQTNVITIKENTLTTLNFTNTQLKIKISSNVTLSFNISQYNSHSNIPTSTESAHKFLDLISTITDISEATLKVYYTDQDITDIDESSLKLYYFNETSSSWQPISTIVNNASNYIEASLTHFSTYGLFGDGKSTPTQSPSRSEKSDSRIAPQPVSLPKSIIPTAPSPQSSPTSLSTTTPTAPSTKPSPKSTPTITPSPQPSLTGQVVKKATIPKIKPLAFIIIFTATILLFIIIKIEHSRYKKSLKTQ